MDGYKVKNIISGGALCSDVSRVLENDSLSDKEKLERIQIAVDLYIEWNSYGMEDMT